MSLGLFLDCCWIVIVSTYVALVSYNTALASTTTCGNSNEMPMDTHTGTHMPSHTGTVQAPVLNSKVHSTQSHMPAHHSFADQRPIAQAPCKPRWTAYYLLPYRSAIYSVIKKLPTPLENPTGEVNELLKNICGIKITEAARTGQTTVLLTSEIHRD